MIIITFNRNSQIKNVGRIYSDILDFTVSFSPLIWRFYTGFQTMAGQ